MPIALDLLARGQLKWEVTCRHATGRNRAVVTAGSADGASDGGGGGGGGEGQGQAAGTAVTDCGLVSGGR